MATCRDCEYFMLAQGYDNQNGERCKFCPLLNMTVYPADKACPSFRNAYEGIFVELSPKE